MKDLIVFGLLALLLGIGIGLRIAASISESTAKKGASDVR